MQQLTWIDHIQTLQETLNESPSSFVRQFGQRLQGTIECFIQKQSLLPLSSQHETSAQKAFVHALQLYDPESLLKLIANYDSTQDLAQVGRVAIQKSLHSLRVIPSLKKLTATPRERELLFSYRRHLKTHLACALSYPVAHLTDAGKMKQILKNFSQKPEFEPTDTRSFFEERLNLLFSSEYQIYLIVKNRYFLNYLLQEGEDHELFGWLHTLLDQIGVPSGKDITIRLTHINFRTIEYLVQLMIQKVFLKTKQGASPALLSEIMEVDILFEKDTELSFPSASLLQVLRDIENIPIAPPLAQESQGNRTLSSAPAPLQPLQRSPFEQLCLQYTKALLYLANHTELATDCSAPYFRPKVEEYVSAHQTFFEKFFEPNPRILAEFSQLTLQLLEKTASANPFEIQKEEIGIYAWSGGTWQVSETQERVREWSVLLKSQLPFPMTMAAGNEILKIEKGRPFIIQLGRAYFDYDRPQPQRIRTQPTGYFKILLRGSQLIQDSAVIYAGRDPYYKLTDLQLQQWRGLILLYLIVVRNQYSVALSSTLEDYLVQMIPALIKPDLCKASFAS